MVKGTPSRGKHQKIQVITCRRCGRRAFHITKGECAACGFGKSSRIRKFAWQTKFPNRHSRKPVAPKIG